MDWYESTVLLTEQHSSEYLVFRILWVAWFVFLYLCICVFVYLCICVFASRGNTVQDIVCGLICLIWSVPTRYHLCSCICVFVFLYLCICISVFVYLHPDLLNLIRAHPQPWPGLLFAADQTSQVLNATQNHRPVKLTFGRKLEVRKIIIGWNWLSDKKCNLSFSPVELFDNPAHQLKTSISHTSGLDSFHPELL